tara:strand:+ start:344 stop:700 length:357 start_codon:yes stop_codon:yes gene_type:complete
MKKTKPIFIQDKKDTYFWTVNADYGGFRPKEFGHMWWWEDEEIDLVFFNPLRCNMGVFCIKISDFPTRMKAINAMKRFIKFYVTEMFHCDTYAEFPHVIYYEDMFDLNQKEETNEKSE